MARRAAFDLYLSKLRRPLLRPGTVRRSSLIKRLADCDSGSIVSVAAPAGYGKTTLLAQWAEASRHPFAWVSVDQGDNDPKVLLSYIAEALDAVEPIDGRVFGALASPASSVPGSVVPRLASAFATMTTPVVLVLDDVHLLHDSQCRSALSVLADHVPKGSRLVLAGRNKPALRVARLRAEGRITEIGPADLSLTVDEAAAVLHDAGAAVSADEVAELHRRTEGWPAGLYLAALALREGGLVSGAAFSFGGDDRLVSEYIESEFLARISRRDRVFLVRTAVLEQMCGPLCEAVLDLPGSAATLAELARSNLLLVPSDRRGQWYRYHRLFRDMLLAELDRAEPDLVPTLRRRAASWHLRHGRPQEALEYAMAAGDVRMAARLVEKLVVSAYWQGRTATVQRWVRWLDDRNGIEERPVVAVWASLIAAFLGYPAEAERRADAIDRWEYGDATRVADPVAEAWAAVARAWLCRLGVKQMRADADEAAWKLAAAGVVTPAGPLLQGIGCLLCGDLDDADAFFADAVSTAEEVGSSETQARTLAERALVAIARGDWGRAESLAVQAGSVLRRIETEYPLVSAVQARVAVHRGDTVAARQQLVSAQRVRHLMTYAQPHVTLQAQLQLTRVHLALADLAGARALMREADELLKRRPDLGTLTVEAQALRTQLFAEGRSASPGASALTAAELRVLPLLSTHLSFPEIAAELFVTRNTVKSQVLSIYRKLDASSRNQAVGRARQLGLLEG